MPPLLIELFNEILINCGLTLFCCLITVTRMSTQPTNLELKQMILDLTKVVTDGFAAQNERFAEQDKRFAEQDKRFTAQDKLIAKQNERFEAQDKRFAEQDKHFAEQDRRFEAQDERFAEQDKRFAEQDKRFDAQDDRFTKLENQIKEQGNVLLEDLKQYIDGRFMQQEASLEALIDQKLQPVYARIDEKFDWLYDQTSSMFGVVMSTMDELHDNHEKRIVKLERLRGLRKIPA